jgi:hypothetical protein
MKGPERITRALRWVGGPIDRWAVRRCAAGLREDAAMLRAKNAGKVMDRLADRLDARADQLDPQWRV